jgi:hypothetical protein
MTTGTTGRTALPLALMKTGDDLRPGSAGALPVLSHPQGRPGLWSRLLSALVGCRRGSRNLRDPSSPRQATSSGKAHNRTADISRVLSQSTGARHRPQLSVNINLSVAPRAAMTARRSPAQRLS